MLRASISRGSFLAWMYPFNLISTDDKPIARPNSEAEEKMTLMPGEIGLDRLKKAFDPRQERFSNELRSIITTTFFATSIGFFLGGSMGARSVPKNFMETNQATRFYSKFEAQRMLQTEFSKRFMATGFTMARQLGIFVFMFGSISTAMNVYRAKHEIYHYTVGGALAGAMYKINLGLRGSFAGAVVGSSIGTVYGLVAVVLLYMVGVSIEDLYRTQSSWIETRNKHIQGSMIKNMEEMETSLSDSRILFEANQAAKAQGPVAQETGKKT